MSTEELTGKLYDIQGFSVQDGPGIRTTAFLKGCPLRCPWCHSPESQQYYPQLSWISMRCQGTEICKERCIKACPKGAVEPAGERLDPKTNEMVKLIHVNRTLCDNCGKCAEVCYPNALYICGEDYTVDRLVKRLLQDKPFYDRSGGGVTISGGECLTQIDFVVEVAKRLKAEGVHIAIDTTGFASWETVQKILPYTDLFLYDLKHMDSEKHKAVVAVPNEPIIDNARKIAAAGGKLQIRIPVIPLFNSDDDNLRKTAEFCAELGDAVELVQLLPYHNLGVTKYLRISDDPVAEATPPSDEFMQRVKSIFEEYPIKHVTIH
ncbi:MAG: glycyl-radical enzyme activating protein [Oscillospiraceae bacterium]|nr:glycyl-radical enzyme activating protein [Oscillospiraceae bacterium]